MCILYIEAIGVSLEGMDMMKNWVQALGKCKTICIACFSRVQREKANHHTSCLHVTPDPSGSCLKIMSGAAVKRKVSEYAIVA